MSSTSTHPPVALGLPGADHDVAVAGAWPASRSSARRRRATYSRSESNSVPWPRTRTADAAVELAQPGQPAGRCLRDVERRQRPAPRPATSRVRCRAARPSGPERAHGDAGRRAGRRAGSAAAGCVSAARSPAASRSRCRLPAAPAPTAATRRARSRAYAGAARCWSTTSRCSAGCAQPHLADGRRLDARAGAATGASSSRRATSSDDRQQPQPHGADRRAQHDRHQPQQEQQRDPPGDRHAAPSARDRDRAERAVEHRRRRRRPRARPRGAAPAGARRVALGQRLDVVGRHEVAAGQPGPGPGRAQQRGRAARADAEAQRRATRGWRGRCRRCSRRPRARPARARTRAPARPRCRAAPATGRDPGAGDVARVEAVGVPAQRSRTSSSRSGQRQHHLEQEPVELGLGQRVGALVLDRVLGGGDQERRRAAGG